MIKNYFKYLKPLLAVVFWGCSFIATKIALCELNPQQIIFLRLILAIFLLSIIAFNSGIDLSTSFKNLLNIFLLALVAVFHLWIQVTGLQFTSAINTGWIIGLTPIFMAFLGLIIFKEKINKQKIAGITIALIGFWLLISKGNFFSIGLISNKGDFLVLASSFTWSIYSAINKKVTLSFSPLLATLFLFLIMIILISPFTLNNELINSVLNLSLKSILSILFLGFFCSGIAYVFWADALKNMQSIKVGSFLYLEPFVTVMASLIFLSEEINLIIIISGLVITAGVILVNK